MRFLLDHDVPQTIARLLTRTGHDAVVLRDVLPIATPDSDVLDHAYRRSLILVSCNRMDYLALAHTHLHSGIVILIRRRTRTAECAALLKLLGRAGESGIRDNINFA